MLNSVSKAIEYSTISSNYETYTNNTIKNRFTKLTFSRLKKDFLILWISILFFLNMPVLDYDKDLDYKKHTVPLSNAKSNTTAITVCLRA